MTNYLEFFFCKISYLFVKNFEFIRELAVLITPNKLKLPRQLTGNLKIFYHALRNEKITTKSQLIHSLELTEPYYWKLSGQLKERLLYMLFFVKLDTEIRKAYIKVFLYYAISKILLGLGARSLASKIAEDTIQIAIKFELIDAAYWFARLLRYHHAAISGNQKKFTYFIELTNQYREILVAEDLADLCLSEVLICLINGKISDKELQEIVEEKIKLLEQYKWVETFRFRLFYYNLLAHYKELGNENTGLIKVCDQSIEFFLNKPQQTPNATIISFLFKKVPAQIQLKIFEEAKETLEYGLSLVHPYDHNWYVFHQYYVIWCFHSKKYQAAWEIIKRLNEQKRMPDKSVIEAGKIYKAFVYYFVIHGLIKTDDESNFNVFKFLNSVPSVSKDKIGFNVAIKIVEFLFLLTLGDKGRHKIIDQAKSLEEYNRNHLSRRKDVVRSYIFIKMLLQFPRGSFRKAVVEYKAKKYYKMLLDNPLNVSRQVKELEIVPYEVLWELALKSI